MGFQSCFISYSAKNQKFAERIHADLRKNGVRCWFAPEDLKIGEPFRQRIDEAIHVYERLLLILSAHSVQSDWVREETESCLERERREGRFVLFPVRLDDAVMRSDQAWTASIRRQRHIGDFRNWQDQDVYQRAFHRLLRDLGGGEPEPTQGISWEEFNEFKRSAIDPEPMGPVTRLGMNRSLPDEVLRGRLAQRIKRRDPVYLLLDEYQRRLEEQGIRLRSSG